MIDCSPGAVNSPEARLNSVNRARDNIQKQVKNLKKEIKKNESDVNLINQSIEMNKRKYKEQRQIFDQQSNILTELENKISSMSVEYNFASDQIRRYTKMTKNVASFPNNNDVKKEITDLRANIIQMEKDIIEYKNQSLLAEQIVEAQKIRTGLIQNDAKLLQKLNSLIVQLRILQYTGDRKLLTDSEFIIEKQLTSEELRNELEGTLEKKQLKRTKKFKDSISFNHDDDNDDAEDEVRPLIKSIQSIKERLNVYLKRDRRIDEMERGKRIKLNALQKLEASIEKYKTDLGFWRAKRDNMSDNFQIVQDHIDLMKKNKHPDPDELKQILKEKQLQYQTVKQRRNKIKDEMIVLTIDTAKAESVTWKNKIDQALAELESLEKSKSELITRQETFKKLNSENGIREVQEMERSYQKVENELDAIILSSSRIRRRKKELNSQIEKILISLTNRGITAPPYTFKSHKGDSDT